MSSAYCPEKAAEDLEVASSTLRTWKAGEDSDSVLVQKLRTFDLVRASSLLYELIHKVQPTELVQLTVGEIAIEGSSFMKGAYDFYSEHPVDIAPKSQISCIRADYYGRASEYELYVGDYEALVAVSSVAATLRQGGRLDIVASD